MFTFKKNPVIKQYFVLGTIVQFKAYGKNAEEAIHEAAMRLNDIDDKMSVFKDYSEISKINMNTGNYEEVSEDTYLVIENAVKYSKLTEGTFDPTIGPLVNLWNIGTDNARIPDKDEIEERLKLVNYEDIILDNKNSSIKLCHKSQAVDVGGIAKGYAADVAARIFAKNHIRSAIIDLGGNIFALGRKPGGKLWDIGIQNPLRSRGEYIAIISVKNKSIVTSGNYERYFMAGGKKFHHIIDPRTGYPSASKIISATIISDKSITGDGLSTGAYILGVDKTMELIESIPGVDAILITEDRNVYATSGIRQNIKLIDNDFMLI